MDSLHASSIQDITFISPSNSSCCPDIFRILLGRLLVDIQQGNLGPALSQRLGKAAAQHSAGAGNYHRFAGKINLKW